MGWWVLGRWMRQKADIATAPSRGPGASSSSAYRHPIASATIGTNWMVTTVTRNPMAVCAVNAVPTNRASTVSLSEVEKTPDRRSPRRPRSTRRAPEPKSGAEKNIGDATQHAPLITSADTAAGERPKRSDAHPPSRHPTSLRPRSRRTTIIPVDAPRRRVLPGRWRRTGQPGPQGVELPHVPEVAEACAPRSAVGEDRDAHRGFGVTAPTSRCGPGRIAVRATTPPAAVTPAAISIRFATEPARNCSSDAAAPSPA